MKILEILWALYSLPSIESTSSWLAAMIGGSIVMGYCALQGPFLIYRPNFKNLALRFLVALIIPALTEETIFRAIPFAIQNQPDFVFDLGMVGIYVGRHLFEAKTFLKAARPWFYHWRFLSCAGILGVTGWVMLVLSGSIWPVIFYHALVVWVWQTFFGGFEVININPVKAK